MLKNYLVVALRNMKRNKLFSFINLLCLSLGITFFLLIGVYIHKEKNVNAGLTNASNHYLVKSNWKIKNMGLDITTLGPLAKTMREQYPDLVANYYRYNPVTNVVSAGNNHFKEDIAIGDTTFISMYGFRVLHGNKVKPFHNDNSAVITESMAKKLFGKTDAINQTISVQTLQNNEKQDYLVSAVIEDIPFNSVTGLINSNYTVFVPTTGSRYYQVGDPSTSWTGAFEVSYLELQEGVKPADLRTAFRKVLEKNTPENIHTNLDIELAAVRDYYLKDNNGAVEKMITTLALIGGFILLMAVINFVNISIGTSSYRLKEIGLRKVLGGKRKQLVTQFLSESLLLSLIAGLISLAGYSLLRPVFNELLHTSIAPVSSFEPMMFAGFVLFLLVVGLVSGLYPAFVLSASNLSFSVKGKMASAGSGSLLRKSLLIVQFSLTIIVFIGALHVSRQVSHIFNKDLGYNKEQLMVLTAFPKQWDSAGVLRMEQIKRQLLELPVVRHASLSFEVPDRKPPGSISLLPVDNNSSQPLNIPVVNVDEDYAAAFEMTMKSGHFFNHGDKPFVPGQVVMNETAVRSLGLDLETAVGRQVQFPAGMGGPLTIAGIIRDYNHSNVQDGVEPIAFMHVRDNRSYRFLTVRIGSANMGQAVAAIRDKWQQASPGSPFEYFFMDDKFESLYNAELQLKKAANVGTLLNLIIVLLGVFGVVAFTLSKRNKEIAVRKVLGANAREIVRLFLKEYGITILVANVIAWPLAYMIVGNWLQHYNYRIEQDIVSYLFVGACVFCLAFLLIILQCFKVAVANPVNSLRTE